MVLASHYRWFVEIGKRPPRWPLPDLNKPPVGSTAAGNEWARSEGFARRFLKSTTLPRQINFEDGLWVNALTQSRTALLANEAKYILICRLIYDRPAQSRSDGGVRATGDSQFALPYGCGTIVQYYALGYQQYLYRFGAAHQEMAALVISQRTHASGNEQAYFRHQPLTVEEYLNSPTVADPLKLLDCDMAVEACASFVMTTTERARDARGNPAYVAASVRSPELGTRWAGVHYAMADHAEAGATLAARLWSEAKLGPRDVDTAQLYDGFSPIVYYWMEALGLCGNGEAHAFIQNGRMALGGELPLNTAGGHLSEGRLHGTGHLAEAVRQVSGRAGARQVPDCQVAVSTEGLPGYRGGAILLTSSP